jgi:protein phosphatase
VIPVTFGAATSAGRVRDHNEDNYQATYPVFVVADGMGGHAAGEVASAIVVAQLARLGERSAPQPMDVAEALVEANEQIVFKSGQSDDRSGMGTTACGLVAVAAAGVDHWLVFNVGDSRVYRYVGGSLRQVSTDHSEVQELVEAGEITAEQARTHPRRNVITRSLGSLPAPRPDLWLVPPTLGERYVLCSDGLSGELTDPEIEQLLRAGGDAQSAADALVAQAVAAGGRDNVTVVVIDVVGVPAEDADADTVPRDAA